jgi:hypothetical protein
MILQNRPPPLTMPRCLQSNPPGRCSSPACWKWQLVTTANKNTSRNRTRYLNTLKTAYTLNSALFLILFCYSVVSVGPPGLALDGNPRNCTVTGPVSTRYSSSLKSTRAFGGLTRIISMMDGLRPIHHLDDFQKLSKRPKKTLVFTVWSSTT